MTTDTQDTPCTGEPAQDAIAVVVTATAAWVQTVKVVDFYAEV